MTYIVIALKSEAQAFVDRYRLKKEKLATFSLFYNENMRLIVSGLGVINARIATQALINQYDITDEDIYVNVGICGASSNNEIGTLLEIGEVLYSGISYQFSNAPKTLTCVDSAMGEALYEIVDMESYGFLDAVTHNPAIKKFHILKVVSDHFEPEKVTKDATKKLIFNKIDAINKIINS